MRGPDLISLVMDLERDQNIDLPDFAADGPFTLGDLYRLAAGAAYGAEPAGPPRVDDPVWGALARILVRRRVDPEYITPDFSLIGYRV